MNISRSERKTLEMLSLGGKIIVEKDDRNRPVEADFVTREGWFMTGNGLKEFQSLRIKGYVASRNGGDYLITREGLKAIQATRQANKKRT